MKTLFVIFPLLLLLNLNVYAQEVEVNTIDQLKSDVINIEVSYANLEILTWDKESIKIESKINVNLGQDNDHFSLDISNTKAGIKIESKLDCESISKKVILTKDDGTKQIIDPEHSKWNGWDANDQSFKSMNFGVDADIQMKIYLPESMKLHLHTVYGNMNIIGNHKSVHAHATYGDVESTLKRVDDMDVIFIHSTYGSVDLSLPKTLEAALDLSTSYGEIYSDLALEKDGKVMSSNHCGGSDGKYTMNGGGKAIEVKATYDNIYLRSL